MLPSQVPCITSAALLVNDPLAVITGSKLPRFNERAQLLKLV